ncbi:hypothetical protein D3C81_1335830 [compost metagenome]
MADREVPGTESRYRPHRLAQYGLPDSSGARWNHSTVSAAPLFGVPIDVIASAEGFKFGFRQRLALFQGNQRRNFIRTLTHQIRCPTQDFRTLVGRSLAPQLKATLCRRQRAIQIAGRGQAQFGDQFAGGRVEHVGLALVGAGRPLTVNQQGFDNSHVESTFGKLKNVVSLKEIMFLCVAQS